MCSAAFSCLKSWNPAPPRVAHSTLGIAVLVGFGGGRAGGRGAVETESTYLIGRQLLFAPAQSAGASERLGEAEVARTANRSLWLFIFPQTKFGHWVFIFCLSHAPRPSLLLPHSLDPAPLGVPASSLTPP